MGSKRLHLTEKHTHLRMRDHGYTAKQIAEATGNSRASVYRSFNNVDNGYPLMPVQSHLVGRPRKLNNDDVDVKCIVGLTNQTLLTATHSSLKII